MFFKERRDADSFALTFHQFNVIFVPLLHFEYSDVSWMQNLFDFSFRCLILTSQRAVYALNLALHKQNKKEELVTFLKTKKIFCVGAATAFAIQEIGLHVESCSFEASTVLDLFSFLKENGGPVLCLVGNKRLESLPLFLKENNMDFLEVEVYQTLQKAPENIPDANWYIFFSPSGVEVMTMHFDFLKTKKIAAIGTTTAKALVEHGFIVHAVAAKPNSGCLLESIQAATDNLAEP